MALEGCGNKEERNSEEGIRPREITTAGPGGATAAAAKRKEPFPVGDSGQKQAALCNLQ